MSNILINVLALTIAILLSISNLLLLRRGVISYYFFTHKSYSTEDVFRSPVRRVMYLLMYTITIVFDIIFILYQKNNVTLFDVCFFCLIGLISFLTIAIQSFSTIHKFINYPIIRIISDLSTVAISILFITAPAPTGSIFAIFIIIIWVLSFYKESKTIFKNYNLDLITTKIEMIDEEKKHS